MKRHKPRKKIKFRKPLGLIIILIGLWIFIGGTSTYYQRSLNKTIKENGQKYIGTLKHKDCKTSGYAIFEVNGFTERIDLKQDCENYELGEKFEFYGYKKKFILTTVSISNWTIYSQLIGGVLILLTGILLMKMKRLVHYSKHIIYPHYGYKERG